MLKLFKKGDKKDKKLKSKEKVNKGASNESKDDLSSLPTVPSGLPSLPSGSDLSNNKSSIQRKVQEKSFPAEQKKIDGVKDGLDPKKIEGAKGHLENKHAGGSQGLVSVTNGEESKGPKNVESFNRIGDLNESSLNSVDNLDAIKTDDRKEVNQNVSTSPKVNNMSGQVKAIKESSKEIESKKVPQTTSKIADSEEESKLSIESKKMENSKESLMDKKQGSKKLKRSTGVQGPNSGESMKADKKSDQTNSPKSLVEVEKSDSVADANQLEISSSDLSSQDLKLKSRSENLDQSSSLSSPRPPAAENQTQEAIKNKQGGVLSGQIETSASKVISGVGVSNDPNPGQQQEPENKAKHPIEATSSTNPKRNSKDDKYLVSQSLEATASIPEDDGNAPVGWEKRTSRTSGKPYYLNMYTKKSQWNVPPGPADPPAVPMETIICRHILIKHKDSRWPYSWRINDSEPMPIQRTRQQAIEALEKYRKDILSGELYFADLASAYSDCSSAAVGGDLGRFTRGVMLKDFEDVAFGLEVKQVSEIVETECGYHLIMRLA